MWVIARTLAAVLCMAGVAATYAAARRLWGVREGLVAAAVLAFAFLPVAYSRVAVTDVGSLVGVALALLWSVRAAEEGRTRWFVLAGAAAGLAIGFKYTAGLVLLPLAIAAIARLRADGLRPVAGLAAGGAAAVVVFSLLNPYLFGAFGDWWRDLRDQADVAASDPKPGQESGGFSYYLDSLTWGLGWAGIVAALAGAVLVLWRRPVRGLILVALPLALFAYLAFQSRYFGRWLLPAYPALAMLAAVAVVRAAEAGAAALAGGRDGGAGAGGRRPAARRGRAHRARPGPRGHAQRGPRLPRRDLPARPARVDRTAVPGRLLPLQPQGSITARLRAARAAGVDGAGLVRPRGRRRARVRDTSRAVRPPGRGRAGPAYHVVLGPGAIDDYACTATAWW